MKTLDLKNLLIAFGTAFVAVLVAGYSQIFDSLFAGDVEGAKVAVAALIVGALSSAAEAARQKLGKPAVEKLQARRAAKRAG